MTKLFLIALFYVLHVDACDHCWEKMKKESRISEQIANEQPDAVWRMYFIGRSEGQKQSAFYYEVMHKGAYCEEDELSRVCLIDFAQEKLGEDNSKMTNHLGVVNE